ncbi:hypothetical protein ACP70R_009182 [Stipagrostis hirtigluma subsp. patula]
MARRTSTMALLLFFVFFLVLVVNIPTQTQAARPLQVESEADAPSSSVETPGSSIHLPVAGGHGLSVPYLAEFADLVDGDDFLSPVGLGRLIAQVWRNMWPFNAVEIP